MHLVLFTGGRQGEGGWRKPGSFITIRALSSELEERERIEINRNREKPKDRNQFCVNLVYNRMGIQIIII